MDDFFHAFIITWNFLKLYFVAVWLLIKDACKKHAYYDVPRNIMKKKEVAIVTGGSRGIGIEVVKGLAVAGYHVIIASRNEMEAEEAIYKVKQDHPKAVVEHHPLDLASFDSIKQFAQNIIERKLLLQLLVNNAAVMLVPKSFTSNRLEEHFGVNYVGHFLLTELLIDSLKRTAAKLGEQPRIVNVASDAHRAGTMYIEILQGEKYYTAHGAYMQSKLAMVMWTYKLQRELLGRGLNITVNTVHPGVVDTELYENVFPALLPIKTLVAKLLFKSPKQGSDPILFTALSPSLMGVGGKYIINSALRNSSQLSYDIIIQDKLWVYTKDLIKSNS